MTSLKKIFEWIEVRLGVKELVEDYLTGYLLPRNINFWYSMGSILLFIFAMQVANRNPAAGLLYPRTGQGLRQRLRHHEQGPFGWLIRMCHAVGSNMMVLFCLMHMLSVLFMGSYKSPRELNWLSGFRPAQTWSWPSP